MKLSNEYHFFLSSLLICLYLPKVWINPNFGYDTKDEIQKIHDTSALRMGGFIIFVLILLGTYLKYDENLDLIFCVFPAFLVGL